jgi:hypothetical protein
MALSNEVKRYQRDYEIGKSRLPLHDNRRNEQFSASIRLFW